jgi:hypothetical protein
MPHTSSQRSGRGLTHGGNSHRHGHGARSAERSSAEKRVTDREQGGTLRATATGANADSCRQPGKHYGFTDCFVRKVADSCREKTCQNSVMMCRECRKLNSRRTIENIGLYGVLRKISSMAISGLANRRFRPLSHLSTPHFQQPVFIDANAPPVKPNAFRLPGFAPSAPHRVPGGPRVPQTLAVGGRDSPKGEQYSRQIPSAGRRRVRPRRSRSPFLDCVFMTTKDSGD